MSVAEMKMKAVNQIINLKDEESVKEILEHLEKLNATKSELNLSQHYNTIKEQYGDVLEKLAQ